MIFKHPSSIRRFLLTATITALLIASIISGAASWLSAKTEMDEVYNANLIQVAKAIKAHHNTLLATPLQEPVLYGEDKGQISAEEDFFVRITGRKGNLLYISHPNMHLPVAKTTGFSKFIYQNQKWRIYVITSKDDKIEVAQSIKLRHEAINEVLRSLLLPQLIFIPIFGFFLWVIVGISLNSLNLLSGSLNRRHDGLLLEPISLDRAPNEIKPLVNSLNTLLDRLGKNVSVLRQFTSDAAHELRTPLTALKLQLANLHRAENEEQRSDAIKQLGAGIERAISLVQQLLTLARMEPEATELQFVTVDLSELAKESIKEFLPFATDKNIDLGIDNDESVVIEGHKNSLKILFNNLIDNALRYTPAGGRVDIGLSEKNGRKIFKIVDTGPGINKQDFERIFDRFYRGLNNHDTSGTGLGLAIVKEVAERHGAVIELQNASDTGGLIIEVIFSN